MAALLQMSLADGLAAIIGTRYGKQSYLIFGHRKSWIGSLTFLVVSLGVLVAYMELSGVALDPVFMLCAAAGAMIIENLGIRGLDNVLVPLLIAWLLSMS